MGQEGNWEHFDRLSAVLVTGKPEKGTPLADCPYVVSVLSIPAIAI
jgi:hypothetical protein